MKRKGKAKVAKVVLIFLGIVVVGLGAGIRLTAPGRQELKNLTIEAIDFGVLKDGTYIGEYLGQRDSSRNTKVQVTVRAGRVAEIVVLEGAVDENGAPQELLRGLSISDIFDEVMGAQSLQVDVISGATLTSKAHLKALENALMKAR